MEKTGSNQLFRATASILRQSARRLLLACVFYTMLYPAVLTAKDDSDDFLSLEFLEYLVDIECDSDDDCAEIGLFELLQEQTDIIQMLPEHTVSQDDGDQVED